MNGGDKGGTLKIISIVGLVLAVLVAFPSIFESRPDFAETLEWGVDLFGVLFGFFGAFLVSRLISRSGGVVAKGLQWFGLGMMGMGVAFMIGPVTTGYGFFDPDIGEGIHGSIMLLGMIGLTLALYSLLRVASSENLNGKQRLRLLMAFILCFIVAIPAMFEPREIGGTVEFWTHLSGFGLAGVMIALITVWYRKLGTGYQTAILFLFSTMLLMSLAYVFTLANAYAKGQGWWSDAMGEVLHHGTMTLAMVAFLATVFYLQRLPIFANKTQREYQQQHI